MHIIEILDEILIRLPLRIEIGMLSISIGGIISEIIKIAVDVLIILIIIYLIRSRKRMEKQQEEIIKLLKDKED